MPKPRSRSNQAGSKPGRVPFLDLPRQHKPLKAALLKAIGRTLDSGRFILGPEVAALEQDVAGQCGASFGIGMNSGTDGLVLALKALEIRPGDEVIVPDFTFVATATAVLLAGAVPVLVDVEPGTLTLDPRRVEEAITPRTRALIPVHLYGQPADMDSLLAIARQRKLAVIEDACQALGSRWRGKPVGALGEMGCLSFFPTKNLGGLGDGGMVLTRDEKLAGHLRRLRQHGADRKYYHDELGYNSRLDEIQAAVLRVKLKKLALWNRERRARAEIYRRGLEGSGVTPPSHRPGAEHVYHQYAVMTPKRDALQAYLHQAGIETAIHYPLPLHRQPALRNLPSAAWEFPVSERAAGEVLCLPIAPEIPLASVKRVCAAVHAFFSSREGA